MLALPRTASDKSILNADAGTMQISNQKNDSAGACVHYTAIPDTGLLCPNKALAQRVIHICAHTNKKNAFLCSYWDDIGCTDVTNSNICYAVKFAAKMLEY